MKTVNELVAAMAKRAEELANLSAKELRKLHPDCYNTGTDYEAREATRGMTLGRVIADILTEEFSEDFDKEIVQD